MGYLYKIWKLDNKRKICIRSTVHSYIPKGSEEAQTEEAKDLRANKIYQNVYALIEYENNKTNWKANLDS